MSPSVKALYKRLNMPRCGCSAMFVASIPYGEALPQMKRDLHFIEQGHRVIFVGNPAQAVRSDHELITAQPKATCSLSRGCDGRGAEVGPIPIRYSIEIHGVSVRVHDMLVAFR